MNTLRSVLLLTLAYGSIGAVENSQKNCGCQECDPFNPRSGTYLYVATGFDDETVSDALTTVDLKTGEVIALSHISGNKIHNEPHHIGFSNHGTQVVFGGLLSLLPPPTIPASFDNPSIFYFDITNRRAPTFVRSYNAPQYNVPDEFLPYLNGRNLLSMMGARDGGTPGAIAEFDASGNWIANWPVNPPEGFNPHGFDYAADADMLISGDFVNPISVVVGPPEFRNTVRIWKNFSVDHAITRTLSGGPEVDGFMSALFIPHNPDNWAYACGHGVLCLVKPNEPDDSLAITSVLTLPEDISGFIAVNRDGTRLIVPTHNNLVYLDISNPEHPIILDMISIMKFHDGQMCSRKPMGAHYIKYSPDERYAYVTDYFITTPIIEDMGDRILWRAIVTDDQLINDPCFEVDFKTLSFEGETLSARPHGLVVVNGNDPQEIDLEPECVSFAQPCDLDCNELKCFLEQMTKKWIHSSNLNLQTVVSRISESETFVTDYNTALNATNDIMLNFGKFYGDTLASTYGQLLFLFLSQGFEVVDDIADDADNQFNQDLWTIRAENLANFLAGAVPCIKKDEICKEIVKYKKYLFRYTIAVKDEESSKASKLAKKYEQTACKIAKIIEVGISEQGCCGNDRCNDNR